MNDTATPKPEPTTPRRKRKATTPRSPRTIDPGVAAIRAEAAAKVKQYHAARKSSAVLDNITTTLVPKLTQQDIKSLAEFLVEHIKQLP